MDASEISPFDFKVNNIHLVDCQLLLDVFSRKLSEDWAFRI